MPWTKPGPGRPPGRTTPTATERAALARTFAAAIVDDAEYRNNLKMRAIAGTLHPTIEAALLAYRFGRPAEDTHLSISTAPPDSDLSSLTSEQLASRAELIASSIRSAANRNANTLEFVPRDQYRPTDVNDDEPPIIDITPRVERPQPVDTADRARQREDGVKQTLENTPWTK